jgi:hypothetical protein
MLKSLDEGHQSDMRDRPNPACHCAHAGYGSLQSLSSLLQYPNRSPKHFGTKGE